MRHKVLATASAITLLFSLSSCAAFSDDSSQVSNDGTYHVATSFYPITWLTEHIGGDYVTVTPLTPPDVEPHDYEFSPKEIAELEKTDLIIYTAGFQPALDNAITEIDSKHVLDLSPAVELVANEDADEHDHEGNHEDSEHHHESEADEHNHSHDHGAYDPHFWLDPHRMIHAAQEIEKHLEELDSAHADYYRQRLGEVTAKLEALDAEFDAGLKNCQSRTLISNHDAFGYLARAYDLENHALSIDAESETSPARIKELAEIVKEEKVGTIFTEERTSSASTQALAEEAGVTLSSLSPLELAPTDGDYTEAMRVNLQSLRKGLMCE